MFNKTNGIRHILIYALNRKQLVDFIKRKDHAYLERDMKEYSERQLRDIAQIVDKKVQNVRRQKGSLKNSGSITLP